MWALDGVLKLLRKRPEELAMMCSQRKELTTDKENRCYVQNPNIAERSIDDAVFLVDSGTDIVFYLDSLGTGIWHLLKEPVSMTDATRVVQQAFPEMPPEEIARDVSTLISDMSRRNLVLNVE
jgi:hypothetical protein